MKLTDARAEAQRTANESGMKIVLVNEGAHADEFAHRDEDGNSYGYCPVEGASILYKHGKIIETLSPANTTVPTVLLTMRA